MSLCAFLLHVKLWCLSVSRPLTDSSVWLICCDCRSLQWRLFTSISSSRSTPTSLHPRLPWPSSRARFPCKRYANRQRHRCLEWCLWCTLYTVIHNYASPYKKWDIFVARLHLWLQFGMVKPEIMCETVLNLSTLITLTYLLISWRNGSAHYWCSNQTVAHTSSCVH